MRGPSGEIIRRADDTEARDVKAGQATKTRVLLGADDGMPHFALRKFSMGEGGGMPLHTNTVEHEQYVLAGRALVRIGDESHPVRQGDVVFIPAGVPHSYEVEQAPFEFLCIVPNLDDSIEILG